MAKKSTALVTKSDGESVGPARPEWAKELSDREFAFVSEYLVDLNASAALRRMALPDISEGSIWETASQLKKRAHVARAIDAAMAQDASGPRQWIVSKLAAIANSDIKDLLEWDEAGKLTLKASKGLPPEISSLVRKVYRLKNGEMRFELHDPVKALEILAKVSSIGLVADRIDINATVTLEALVLGAMKLKEEKGP